MKQVRVLKIVVVSPGDVQAERDAIPAIVDELNKGIADERGVRLEVYRWETDAYPAFHPLGPQGQIDSCLRIDDCDLIITIFWKRFGTPVLDANSGTEHEIRVALEACEKMGRPQLMLYFNQAPHIPQSQAEKEQWQQVLDFKQSLSQKVLWWDYNGKDQFPNLVRQHLTKFIRGDYSGRPLEELLQAYHDYLTRRVGTVRIFGEAETRPLEKVFVELTLTEEYERPTANAQWLGMMDAELRRRRDIFARDDENEEKRQNERREKVKHTLKPDELLRRRTRAVIVGAPGCGKTTLLRYLTLKTLQTDKRFPVFLELKSISGKAIDEADGNLIELLFAKAVAAPLGLSAAETERCKAFFLARLKAGEVTIFLDGLDEVAGSKFFNALCRSVNDFMASAYRHNDLIISTRPYALQQRFEGMQEMEIASLNPRQIEAFLQHYYGDDPTTKKLQQELRRRRELQEMARVPFLLSVIAYLYRRQGEIVGERLELYRQLVQQLVTQLDREKNVERFSLPDPDGSLKRDFLKQLAYDRLFVDEVEKDAERLILTGEVIAAKARMFCQTHLMTNPHLLAADVKATPLLREIGADTYAFSHLTLQEYLAAVALAEQSDCEKIFCHAYFNSTLAETEVLPMTLGLVRKPDDFYKVLEGLPESLNFRNLRLRARGMAYVQGVNQEHQNKLVERLKDFIILPELGENPYQDITFQSFSRLTNPFLDFIVDHVASLFYNKERKARMRVVLALGEIGGKRAVEVLSSILMDKEYDSPELIVNALGKIRTEHSLEVLLALLNDKDIFIRARAVEKLGEIGSESAVQALVKILMGEDYDAANISGKGADKQVAGSVQVALENRLRRIVAEALRQIGGESAVEALFAALRHQDRVLCMLVAESIGKIGSDRAEDALHAALKDDDIFVHIRAIEALGEIRRDRTLNTLLSEIRNPNSFVRERAAWALGRNSSKLAVEALLVTMNDADSLVREHAIRALGRIGDERALDMLSVAVNDKDWDIRKRAVEALGEIASEFSVEVLLLILKNNENQSLFQYVLEALGKIGSERTIDDLIHALENEDFIVRLHAAEALGKIGSKRSVDALLLALKDEDIYVRWKTAEALGKIGSERSVDALLLALKDKSYIVREQAANALDRMSDTTLGNGLSRALSDNDSLVRQKAAQVIGYYTTDKQVLATLQHMAVSDPAEEVRIAAREAAEKYANKLRYFASKE